MSTSQLLGTGSVSVADAATRFFSPVGKLRADTTDAISRMPIRLAGTIDNLYVRVTVNDVATANSVVVTVMKTGVAQALTVSYGSSATGILEDTGKGHSFSVANTDWISHRVAVASVSGSHAATIATLGCSFTATDTTKTLGLFGGGAGTGGSSASTLYYGCGIGSRDWSTTLDVQGRVVTPVAGTLSNFEAYINGVKATASTYYVAKGGTQQALTFSDGAATGSKEDATHTVSLVANDTVNFQLQVGTGAGTAGTAHLSCTFINTAKKFPIGNGTTATITQNANLTRYYALGGDVVANATETDTAGVSFVPRFTMYLSDFSVYVTAITMTDSTTFRTRDNAGNGQLSVSYASGETGLKTATASAYDTITSGTDGANFQVITGATGTSITFTYMSVWGSDSLPTQAYAFDVLPGGYTLSGADALTVAGRKLDATAGDYTLTGLDSLLAHGYSLDAATGGYVLTGANTDLIAARILDAGSATYAISGADAGLLAGYIVNAETGGYAITGAEALTVAGRCVEAGAGAYLLTGADAALIIARMLDTVPGAYVITGSDANLVWTPVAANNYELDAESGAYALTGAESLLVAARILGADPGTYGITGADASLVAARILDAAPGTYAISGSAAGLLAGYAINADAGNYSISGADALTVAGRCVEAGAGAYLVSGVDAALITARILDTVPGAYAITGIDANLVWTPVAANNYDFDVEPGVYALTGADSLLIAARMLDLEPGNYALSGADALLLAGRILDAESGAYALTGVDAAILADRILNASAGVYALTGADAVLLFLARLGIGTATLSDVINALAAIADAKAAVATITDAKLEATNIADAKSGTASTTEIGLGSATLTERPT